MLVFADKTRVGNSTGFLKFYLNVDGINVKEKLVDRTYAIRYFFRAHCLSTNDKRFELIGRTRADKDSSSSTFTALDFCEIFETFLS